MGLVPDEATFQELPATSPDPAFGDGVHAGLLDVAEQGPDPGIGEDRVEYSGVVRTAVADHELDPVCLLAQVHRPTRWILYVADRTEDFLICRYRGGGTHDIAAAHSCRRRLIQILGGMSSMTSRSAFREIVRCKASFACSRKASSLRT